MSVLRFQPSRPHVAGVATAIDTRFREAIISHFSTSANRLIVRTEMGENTASKGILL